MREIKFRAWDIDNKRMLDNVSTGTIQIFGNGPDEGQESAKCVFMQFTGLKDKNGKEIYEGDILQLYFREDMRFERAKVSFENACFKADGWYLHKYANLRDCVKIIGNIYENPELMK